MGRRAPYLTTIALSAFSVLAMPGSATATFPGDNGRIAFHRDGDIYTMTSEGRNVRQLTSTRRANEFFASWSPDGKRIVSAASASRSRAALRDRPSCG